MNRTLSLKNLFLGSASLLMLSAVAVHGQVIQGTQEYTLEVTAPEPVAITLASGTLPDAADGEVYDPPFDFKGLVTVSGGPSSDPVTAEDLDWAIVAGSLPFGLNLGAEGVLAGTPSDDGTFTFTVEAAFGDDFDTQEYTLAVASQEPDSFSFPPAFAAAGETATVGPVLIEGFTSSIPIAISGDGNPQYSLDGGNTFTSDPGTIAPDTNLIVRLTAPSSLQSTNEALLDIAGIEAPITMTAEDLTPPESFALADATGIPGEPVESSPVTLSGFDLVNVSAPGFTLSVNDSGFTSGPVQVTSGDTLIARADAPDFIGEEKAVSLVFSSTGSETNLLTVPWNVTAEDPVFAGASNLAFNWDYSDQPTGFIITTLNTKGSNTITIPPGRSSYTLRRDFASNASGATLVGSPTFPQACVNGNCQTMTSSTTLTVQPGDTLRVRVQPHMVNPSTTDPTSQSTWCIDAYCMDFNHTDSNRQPDQRNPDPFTIPDVVDASPGEIVISEPVALTWPGNRDYSNPSRILINISGTDASYRIDGGDWQSSSSWIASGQEIEIKTTAPFGPGLTRTATVSFGTYSQTFNVTTEISEDPLQFLGTASTGSNSSQVPAHEMGDLILAFAYSEGGNLSNIAVPSGFTVISNRSQPATSNGAAGRIAYRYASTSCSSQCSANLGSWGNTNRVIYMVFRNAGVPNAVARNGFGRSYTYPANSSFSEAMTAAFLGNRTASAQAALPVGFSVEHLTRAGSLVIAGVDENKTSGVSAATASTGSTSTRWVSFSVRIPKP